MTFGLLDFWTFGLLDFWALPLKRSFSIVTTKSVLDIWALKMYFFRSLKNPSANSNQDRGPDDEELSMHNQLLQILIGEKKDILRTHSNRFGLPRNVFPVPEQTPEERMIGKAMESCVFKSVLACVLGIRNYF